MSDREATVEEARHRFVLGEGGAQVRIAARRRMLVELLGAAAAAFVGAWAADMFGDSRLLHYGIGAAGAVLVGALVVVEARLRCETLRVRGAMLEASVRYGPFTRTRRWRVDRIARLQGWGGKRGVRFEYEGRVVAVAKGVDEAAGEEIAGWLGKRLPPGATRFE